jgi:hypothetical protein
MKKMDQNTRKNMFQQFKKISVVKTTDCYPIGSGFESQIKYGFSVEVRIFLTFFWFMRTILYDIHNPLEEIGLKHKTGATVIVRA